MVGVDAERGPEVCAISVIRQRAETENGPFANIDDTVEDAQADIARGVQRAASRVDITLDNGGPSSNGTELLGKASFRPPRRGRAGS